MEQGIERSDPPEGVENPTTVDNAIGGITRSVNALTESFSNTYEKHNYAGFVSVLGAILIFVPLVLGRTPSITFRFEEQRLYVLAGVVFVLIGALCVFRSMPATSSGACRAMIPVHVGPPFRSMPAGGCDAG